MTRKHYEALARALAVSHASLHTILAIAEVCEQENPRFDHERFCRAAMETES